jgi:quercetin dioxygenase-like cupin family protein
MKATLAAVVIALGAMAAGKSGTQDVAAVKCAEVKWTEAKGHPKGVMSALVHGDPAKGAFVMLLKAPAGTTWPPHLHSADEVVVVQSGEFMIAPGEKVDESKGMVIDAGGYFSIKGKTPHWATVKKDVVIARYSTGAGDITYCNPADAPK